MIDRSFYLCIRTSDRMCHFSTAQAATAREAFEKVMIEFDSGGHSIRHKVTKVEVQDSRGGWQTVNIT